MMNNLEKKFALEVKKRNRQQKNNLFKKILRTSNLTAANLKRLRPQYILGFSLLVLALASQYNLINNPVEVLATKLVHRPKPPQSPSPRFLEGNNQLHPLIANLDAEVETSIESVANYIADNESDPHLRVKAIHDYVISRVDYDTDVLSTGIRPSQDPITVFKTGKAVCEGYARLFQALARAMGLDAVYIEGRVRRELAPVNLIPSYLKLGTSKYDWTLHAWNAVKVDGSWQLVDTTWDDNRENKYSSDYLMLSPEAMIVTHFPDLADWQLLAETKNYQSFEASPILRPQFFARDLILAFPQQYKTQVRSSASIAIKTSSNYNENLIAFAVPTAKENFLSNIAFAAGADTGNKEGNIEQCHSQNNIFGKIDIACKFSQPGEYKVLIFSEDSLTPLGELKFERI